MQFFQSRIATMNSVKKLTLLLCVVLIMMFSVGTTVSYITTGTSPLVNIFLNGMTPDGNLVIQKTVSHPFGDAYSIPEEIAFTFEVNLGEKYANKTFRTTHGEKTADENGRFTVTVAPGGRTTVYDIDDGTPVTVTETLIGDGFTPDAVSREITVHKHQDNILTFANTYTPEKADTALLAVSGVKTLVGREWIEGDRFTFELELYKDGSWTSLGTQTVTYETVEQTDPADPEKTVVVPKPDFDKFDFSEMIRAYAFDTAGTYSFRVTEAEGTIGGLTYDKAESKFDILVGDADMDGRLEIQSVTTASANTAVENTALSISFENKYAPVGSTESIIEILKVLTDTSGQNKSPAGFIFELYDEENHLIATSDPTNFAGETSIRLVYEPTDAGKTFTYVLKEANGGQTVGALTYDDTEYQIQISVVDNLDGTVSATDTGKMTFTNQYDPQDATVSISGEKALSGRELKDGEFTFLLYRTDARFTLTDDAQPIDRTANTAGTFSFDPLSLDKVGTYHYVVTEDTSAKLGGVTYDSSRYLVTVVVTDENGVLTAKTSITDSFGEEKEIKFVNSYQAAPVFLPLGGVKTLSGASLTDYAFRFQLFVADESFTVDSTVLRTAESDGDGKFTFADLTFTKAGTYRYVVTEDSSEAVEGMTYDDTVYQITVVVGDPGDGQLVISEFLMTTGGNSVTDIRFENTYVGPTEPIEPDKPTEPEEPIEPDEPTEPDRPTKPDEPTEPDKPTEPDEPTEPGDPNDPDTGDDTNSTLWIILMALSIAMFLLLATDRRRKSRR